MVGKRAPIIIIITAVIKSSSSLVHYTFSGSELDDPSRHTCPSYIFRTDWPLSLSLFRALASRNFSITAGECVIHHRKFSITTVNYTSFIHTHTQIYSLSFSMYTFINSPATVHAAIVFTQSRQVQRTGENWRDGRSVRWFTTCWILLCLRPIKWVVLQRERKRNNNKCW